MEFIEGTTLSHWLHSEPRTWRDSVRVFIAAGRGLQHAHEANLVHRDFKPENVMIRLDGEVRVMDFGLVRRVDALDGTHKQEGLVAGAKFVDDDWALTTTANLTQPPGGQAPSGEQGVQNAKLTQSGVLVGTPAYMSPEQFSGQITDARSDQFSFCIALYEALFKARPFSGATIYALAASVVSERVERPPGHDEVPAMIWQALRRGLSVNPADRYPSMNELLADLGRHSEPPHRSVPRSETLPSSKDLASLLETLLQRPVRARHRRAKSSHLENGVVAVYVGDDGAAEALVYFDLPAAGSTAAALTSLPANMVRDASLAGHLSPVLMDNLLEISNVLTKLVRGMSIAPIRIQGIYPLPGVVPPGVAAALENPPYSARFEVLVSDYPNGRMTAIGLRHKAAAMADDQNLVLKRALVVDDSGAMRLVIGRALRQLGVIDIVEAPDGAEGLRCLRDGADVEAVFVDWSMPVMDGISFTKAVRAERRFDRVRIVMVTTAGEPEQIESALVAGANEYMVKPVSEEVLRRAIESLGLKVT